jgi:hypothetical protein
MLANLYCCLLNRSIISESIKKPARFLGRFHYWLGTSKVTIYS